MGMQCRSDCRRVRDLLIDPHISATAHGTAAKLLARLHHHVEGDSSLLLDGKCRKDLLEACFHTLDKSVSRFHDETAEDMKTTHRLMLLLMFSNRESEVDEFTWRRAMFVLEGAWIHLEQVPREAEGSLHNNSDGEDGEDGEDGNSGSDGSTQPYLADVEELSTQQKCTLLGLSTLCRECNEAMLAPLTTLFLIFARDVIAEKNLTSAMSRPLQVQTFDPDEVYMRTKSVSKQACSELGQNALKDMILSFRMPRGTVGIRRTLLLPRETSTLATRDHTALVQSAHEAAMLTSEVVWQDTEFDVVARSCALLSGLAMLYARDAEDVRDNDAYNGIVELPFLHSKGERKEMRIKLVNKTWVCYDTVRGYMRVHCEGENLDGLVECVMHLTTHVTAE